VKQHTAQKQGWSVQVPGTNSSSLDNMFRIKVLEQIMTQCNGTVTEEEKTVAISKMVIKHESQWPLVSTEPSKSLNLMQMTVESSV
jgi:hypothetical protein